MSDAMLAIALYDNAADTPDELSFIRGDVITVLEEDFNGVEGWWLCESPEGRVGVAPSNRLKIVTSLPQRSEAAQDYDVPMQYASKGSGAKSSPSPGGCGSSDYDIPTTRTSAFVRQLSKSRKNNRSARREIPRPQNLSIKQSQQPPTGGRSNVANRSNSTSSGTQLDDYDVPRPKGQSASTADVVAETISQRVDALQQMHNIVSQIIWNAGRWRASSQHKSPVTSVLKKISSELRSKLLSLISMLETTIHSVRLSVSATDAVEVLRLCAEGLEVCADHQTSQSSDDTAFFDDIVRLAQRIQINVDCLLGEHEHLSVTLGVAIVTRERNNNNRTTVIADQLFQFAPPSLPLKGQPQQKTPTTRITSAPPRSLGSSSSPEEYGGVPFRSATDPRQARLLRPLAVRSLHHEKDHDDSKRLAVVVDKDDGSAAYEVLERREFSPSARLTLSKLVADCVDYDYPRSQPSSPVVGGGMQGLPAAASGRSHAADAQFAAFRQEFDVVVTLIRSEFDERKLMPAVRRLLVAVYRLVFVADHYFRSLEGAGGADDPRRRAIRRHCDDLCRCSKLVATAANGVVTSGRRSSPRLLSSVEKLVGVAVELFREMNS